MVCSWAVIVILPGHGRTGCDVSGRQQVDGRCCALCVLSRGRSGIPVCCVGGSLLEPYVQDSRCLETGAFVCKGALVGETPCVSGGDRLLLNDALMARKGRFFLRDERGSLGCEGLATDRVNMALCVGVRVLRGPFLNGGRATLCCEGLVRDRLIMSLRVGIGPLRGEGWAVGVLIPIGR